jgi:alpha-ketoglutarate-dependent taurine dioxygenase
MNVKALFATNHHPVMIVPEAGGPAGAFREYLAAHRADIDQLVRRYGGVLLRGFGLDGPQEFSACAESLGARSFNYIGGNTPRTNVAANVFTSTEYPASEVIGLHNEMSYLPEWPRRLFFYCQVPARHGGQTSLANSRDVLRALPEDVVNGFREKKLNYIRHFHADLPVGKSWQATYQTEDRAEVERIVADQGSSCTWLPDNVLRVTTQCDAILTYAPTGEDVWFNQAEQWHPSALQPEVRAMFEELVGPKRMPHDCQYGNGEPLEEPVLAEIRQALNKSKLLFDWEPGDLLVVDNVLMMHGRESFTGERKTLAYLSAT